MGEWADAWMSDGQPNLWGTVPAVIEMQDHEYESIRQMQGSMSQHHSDDPTAFERAQYMRAVSSIPPELLSSS